ncbi:MAG: hypothetical protein H6587_01235 [Flavobacteriales bacterium]|nr:hypothetical protein [Flavobacteriales bacterium]
MINANKSILLCYSILITSISIAQRGQVSRDEWDDGGDSSLLSYVVTLLVIFGIPYLLSRYLKSKDEKNKK